MRARVRVRVRVGVRVGVRVRVGARARVGVGVSDLGGGVRGGVVLQLLIQQVVPPGGDNQPT